MPAPPASSCLTVHDLGFVPYARAFALQKDLQREVIAARDEAHERCAHMPMHQAGSMHLLLLEHDPPVITLSRRAGSRQHLLATDRQLRALGIELAETDRGGDITYHGPGQLVVYPILDLNRLDLRIHSYMRMLEDIVISTLAQFNIKGQRDASATGVWLPAHEAASAASHAPPQSSGAEGAKICAMGVRISKWVSMHGLALNVTTNLDHFKCIVPCGLADRSVTSMQNELGAACPTMKDVKRAIVRQFERAIETRIHHAS